MGGISSLGAVFIYLLVRAAPPYPTLPPPLPPISPPALPRPLLHPQKEIVVGSSDHALYVIDAEKGTKKRQLYNKTCGHQE